MERRRVLWMGKVEPYMDKNFIRNAFKQMRVDISGVKMMKTESGKAASYCFVNFVDELSALLALHRLLGKLMPGSLPPVNFHLKHSSLEGNNAVENMHSIFVANLSPDVDNCTLLKGFYERYNSVRRACVIRDENGTSKGYGFVRFNLEEEQKKALHEMHRFKGIGSKLLKVRMARSHPKAMAAVQATTSGQPEATTGATTTQQDHNEYDEQSGTNYASSAQWPNYENYVNPMSSAYDDGPEQPTPQHAFMMPAANQDDALSAPMDMPIPQSSQQVDQQWPIYGYYYDPSYYYGPEQLRPQHPFMMPAVNQDAALPAPMGTQAAQPSQQEGQQWPIYGNHYNPTYGYGPQQSLNGQPPMMPAGYQGVAFQAPMGMQMAHLSGHVVQQQYNSWHPTMTPAAYVPPLLPTPPIGIQMAHSSQYVDQQQPSARQSAAYQGATHPAPIRRRMPRRQKTVEVDQQQ